MNDKPTYAEMRTEFYALCAIKEPDEQQQERIAELAEKILERNRRILRPAPIGNV